MNTPDPAIVLGVLSSILAYAWPLWATNIALNGLSFLKRWDRPLDGGHMLFDGKPIFGASTTWLGLALALALGALFVAAFPAQPLIFWKAVSAYCGHALGCFIKRRIGAQPGSYVPFIVHADYVLFFGALSAALGGFEPALFGWTLAVTVICTPAVTLLAHRLEMRAAPV